MDNVRLFLFMALAFLGMLLYQSWQEDYGPVQQTAAEDAAPATTTAGDTPTAPHQADIDSAAPSVPGVAAAATGSKAGLIKVRTDTLDLDGARAPRVVSPLRRVEQMRTPVADDSA